MWFIISKILEQLLMITVSNSKIQVENPAMLPSNPKLRVTACWEPTVLATIIMPSE